MGTTWSFLPGDPDSPRQTCVAHALGIDIRFSFVLKGLSTHTAPDAETLSIRCARLGRGRAIPVDQ